jgi:uncharacterized protein (TIGR02996 family)
VQEALLQQVLAEPDDDVVRRAYADWLLEHGDEAAGRRGEFIHVQCQLAAWDDELADWDEWAEAARRRPELRAREQELLAAHGAEWAAPLAGMVQEYRFRRGFVEEVTMPGPAFLQHAPQLFRLTPLRRVRFTALGTWQTLFESPHLAGLSGLDLTGIGLGDHALRALLASPHLTGLTSLTLASCHVSDAGAAALADSPLLARVTALDLSRNRIGPAGLQALLSSPYRARLRTLSLEGNHALGAGTLETLTASLKGRPDPAVLRAVLLLPNPRVREYTGAPARDLADEAATAPEGPAAVLTRALAGSRRRLRAAAAQMVARLGAAGLAAVPALVRRLYEPGVTVRENARLTLGRLLPELPAPLQGWLCTLANPLLPVDVNLANALESPELPPAVRAAFAALCARRAAWRARNAGRADAPPPAAEGESPRALRRAVDRLADLAADAAAKHARPAQVTDLRRAAQTRERAWLLARLCELLQRDPAAASGGGRAGA